MTLPHSLYGGNAVRVLRGAVQAALRKLALVLLCGPAWAQEVVSAGGDTIMIREAEGALAEVVYSNSAGLNSANGQWLLILESERGPIEVLVRLRVGNANVSDNETITVEPADQGLIAVPAEASVPDGEMIVIQIMEPMF